MDLFAIILSTILVMVLMAWRKNIYDFVKYRQMISKLPSMVETAYPLIGHSYLLFGKDFFTVVNRIVTKFINKTRKKVGVLWLGTSPLIVMAHPDSFETILRSSKHMSKSYLYVFLHPWLKTGLLTSSGEKWKQRRNLITPTFHFNILQDYLDVMNKQSKLMIDIMVEQHASGKTIDVAKSITLCALDIICEAAMGQSVLAQSNPDSPYVTALYRMSDLVLLRMKTPMLWWDYGFKQMKVGAEHDEALSVLHGFTRSVIEQRMKNVKESQKVSKRMAFLDMLIHATTEDGQTLSQSDIQEEVDTFMFEGHDTTAAAMTWTVYLIGRHPDVQKRLCEEVEEVFGKDVKCSASMEELKKLQYLEQVIKESLRVYPSVPFYGRVTSEDCDIDGYVVPKDSMLMLPAYNLHHHPDVWKDPETFNPERFSKENSVGRHPFAYLPFSAGPRNCIGQRFALLEEKVIISQLLRRFTITCHDEPKDLKMAGDLILRPTVPLNITLNSRS